MGRMLAASRGQTGDLPSGDTDGTCLNFLAPASCARFMRTSQASRFRWMWCLVAVLVGFPTLPGRRLGDWSWGLRLLLLGGRRRLLIWIDLEGRLERGMGKVQVGMGRQQVRHGRRWWTSRTTRGRLSTMLSAPAPL